MLRTITLVFALLIAGCAASPTAQDIKAPDGSLLKAIVCNIDSTKCLEMASQACIDSGGSYKVISSRSNSGGIGADVIPGPVTWYRMTVACGPSDGMLPTFPFQGPSHVVPNLTPQRRTTTQTNCTTFGNNISCVSN